MVFEKDVSEGEKEDQQKKPSKKRKVILYVIILAIIFVEGVFLVTVTENGGFLLNRFIGEEEDLHEKTGTEYKYEVPEILININEEQRGGYLSIKFYLGFNESELHDEIEERMPELRDAVLGILWDKDITSKDVEDKKENIREEILIFTNEILNKGEVKEVYFWHFLVQN